MTHGTFVTVYLIVQEFRLLCSCSFQSMGGSYNDVEKASNAKKNVKRTDSKENVKEMTKESSFVDSDDNSGHVFANCTLIKV